VWAKLDEKEEWRQLTVRTRGGGDWAGLPREGRQGTKDWKAQGCEKKQKTVRLGGGEQDGEEVRENRGEGLVANGDDKRTRQGRA